MTESKRSDPHDLPGAVSVVVGSVIVGALLLVPALLIGAGRASTALVFAGKRMITKLSATDRG